MTLELINPPDLPIPHTYTQVVVATGSRLVFVAGQEPGLLLALAAPAVSLRMAQPSPIALTAPDDPALRTLAAIQGTFPGAGEPAYVAVLAPAAARGALTREFARLQALAASGRIAHRPFQLTWTPATPPRRSDFP